MLNAQTDPIDQWLKQLQDTSDRTAERVITNLDRMGSRFQGMNQRTKNALQALDQEARKVIWNTKQEQDMISFSSNQTAYQNASAAAMGFAGALTQVAVGISAVGTQYEEMVNKFQARTLTADIEMPEIEKQMLNLTVETNLTYAETGDLFSDLVNKHKVDNKQLEVEATRAWQFYDAFGKQNQKDGIETGVWSQAQEAEKYYEAIKDIQDLLGVEGTVDQASDILALALKENSGNLEEAQKALADRKKLEAMQKQTASGSQGSQSFEMMGAALDKGAMGNFTKGLKAGMASLIEIYKAMQPTLAAISSAFYDLMKNVHAFLQTHPGVTEFIAKFMLFAPAVIATTVGMASLTSGAMLLVENMATIGPAVRVWMAQLSILPRMFATSLPIVLRGLLSLPGVILRFAASFYRLNPLLSIAIGIGALIYKNWDKFGPVIIRIIDDIRLAFQPLFNLFEAIAQNVLPQVTGVIEGLSDILAGSLLVSFKQLEPAIRGFANLLNGNFRDAGKAFGAFFDRLKGEGLQGQTNLMYGLGTAITFATVAWASYRAGLVLASIQQWRLNAAMLANPVGVIITAVAALGMVFVMVYQNQDKIMAVFENWKVKMHEIGVSFKNVGNTFKGIFLEVEILFDKFMFELLNGFSKIPFLSEEMQQSLAASSSNYADSYYAALDKQRRLGIDRDFNSLENRIADSQNNDSDRFNAEKFYINKQKNLDNSYLPTINTITAPAQGVTNNNQKSTANQVTQNNKTVNNQYFTINNPQIQNEKQIEAMLINTFNRVNLQVQNTSSTPLPPYFQKEVT
ncbi:hypothetical protein [Brevibacillus dissolubilis]|uniref:hypothetical protein n=1 Tax=Brevibacillus dissolubilis TaxID=1844116 RepID=UPI00159BEB06|nr:hypothetical protein [Brevibacillus dissolubilis]